MHRRTDVQVSSSEDRRGRERIGSVTSASVSPSPSFSRLRAFASSSSSSSSSSSLRRLSSCCRRRWPDRAGEGDGHLHAEVKGSRE
ncbi:MAG: hypothetical protein WC483_00035 [Candidatus Paceibacterota bacterium]